MRTIKLLVCVALVNLFAYSSFAQLSDRVNNPSQFKTGTRPVAGNMGFYLGVSSEDVKAWTSKDSTDSDGDTSKSIIPLVNIKYYISDDLVFRIGVKTSKEKTTLRGIIDTTNTMGTSPVHGDYVNSKSASEFYLSPAIEKHFLNSNLLDAYVVLALPFGYIKEKNIADSNFYGFSFITLSQTNDHVKSKMTKTSLAWGFEGHIGLQAFVADLPLALGFELGISGIGYKGKKYKHEDDKSINGTATKQTYYTTSKNEGYKYKELKSNSFDINGSARLTLSYYFNK